jgi:hypothetical protein
MILHWILNPGLAFNEVVLGQRIPKTQLVCKECDGPLMDRGYVPCPSCRIMHLSRLSSGKGMFGNWRGVACPSCGKAIPCLWNLFSLVILALTFPLWSLPYFLYFRKRPLKPLFHLEDGKPPTPKPVTRKTWIYMGALWGIFMWVAMSLLPALRRGDIDVEWKSALIGLPIWIAGGLAFGLSMWFFLGRKVKQQNESERGNSGHSENSADSLR